MINHTEIQDLVREWGLAEQVVEKDYVIGWVLWGIGSEPQLQDTWVFKGGTCLKKCYIETYRFSEDLDFTVINGGPLEPDDLDPIFAGLLDRVGQECGIDFSQRPPLFKKRGQWPSTEGRIYYRGPRGAQTQRIKLDLLAAEEVVRPTVFRPIAHAYSDAMPDSNGVRCYGFEEVFAEKIRALGERSRARDLYDVINLFRRRDLRVHRELIYEVLQEKCRSKGISVPTFTAIESSPNRPELESEWANMLQHQLPQLPPFEHFWEELPAMFAWLEGEAMAAALAPMPFGADEDDTWAPPPTVWAWGADVPLETIRFAGANHLCVELGYQGSLRVIEPYSLRRTREGNLLLHAVRVDDREDRSYRVDRIESVRVTNQPFRPEYEVEFSQTGPIDAPPTSPRADTWDFGLGRSSTRSGQGRRKSRATRPRSSRSTSSYGPKYIVECPYCTKRFTRKTNNLTLRAHKDKNGYPCSAKRGFLVEIR